MVSPFMNQLVISGVVCKTPKFSQSPAGIPHCIFVVEHKSMQTEADLNRNSYVRLQVVASGKQMQQQTQHLHVGQALQVSGFLNRHEVNAVLAKSRAGLVTLHPIINYIDALPVKMFEYMAAGIPVIASNFPLWREIIEGNKCGLCVDPMNSKEIGKAIKYLKDNPKEAEDMGKNGRKAVEDKYNWPLEEKKLLDLYKRLK